MGTEVLRPQDLLVERFHVSPPSFNRRRNFPTNGTLTNLTVNRRPTYNTGYKRPSPKPDKKKINDGGAGEARRRDDRNGSATKSVTILRRGESLDSLTSKLTVGNQKLNSPPQRKPADDLAVLGRIGLNSSPTAPKQIRLSPAPRPDIYAGSVCTLSPSPRSLPLPSFFNKKQQDDSKIISPNDDPATRDLRRLLRLD